MKKFFTYSIFVLVIAFLFNMSVMAEMCDNDDIARLKVLADNVKVSYEYMGEYENNVGVHLSKYKITIDNLTPEMVIIVDDMFEYGNEDFVDNSFSYDTFNLESKVVLYSKCSDEKKLRDLDISLPSLNPYYNSMECKQLRDYNLEVCDEFYFGEINSDFFYKTINKYLKEGDNSLYDKFISFLLSNYMFLFGFAFLIIVIVISIIVIKKYRKRSVLE